MICWNYRRIWRNGFGRKICNYCGVVVVLFIFSNIAMIHRNVDVLENENFIDAGGTAALRRGKVGGRGGDDTQVFHNNGAAYSSNKIRHIFENKLRRLLEIMETSLDNPGNVNNKNPNTDVHMENYFSDRLIFCDDMANITDREYLASGWTKAVYQGSYQGTPVAIKTVDPKGQDVSTCEESGRGHRECYIRAAKKIVKEIVLLQALADKNVLKVCLTRGVTVSTYMYESYMYMYQGHSQS